MNKSDTLPELLASIINRVAIGLSLIFFALPGWLMNFQNLAQYAWDTKEFILSMVGIFFPPLGVYTGYAF